MKGSKKDKVCFASIDVEHDVGTEDAKSFRGMESMERLLAVFQKFEIPLTLFVTGDVLKGYGEEVKEWGRDYEIASHSFAHIFFNKLSEQEKKEDSEKFVELYTRIFGRKPLGFRAPSHIIDEVTLGILDDAGFLYDSSVIPHYPPFKKYRGYKGKAPIRPYSYKLEHASSIVEIPVSGQMFGIPVAGAWMRKLPVWLYKSLFLFHKPSYITLSMHSWDILDDRFMPKLITILEILKNSGYVFKSGEQIAMERFAG